MQCREVREVVLSLRIQREPEVEMQRLELARSSAVHGRHHEIPDHADRGHPARRGYFLDQTSSSLEGVFTVPESILHPGEAALAQLPSVLIHTVILARPDQLPCAAPNQRLFAEPLDGCAPQIGNPQAKLIHLCADLCPPCRT
jgi:hypothetical protein